MRRTAVLITLPFLFLPKFPTFATLVSSLHNNTHRPAITRILPREKKLLVEGRIARRDEIADREAYLARVHRVRLAALRRHDALLAKEKPPAPPPPPPPPPPVSYNDSTSTNTADWACIRFHESGDTYTENTGNGYYGAYQFDLTTWYSVTGLSGLPSDYPPAVQDGAALKLYNERGWEPWPQTSVMCGL